MITEDAFVKALEGQEAAVRSLFEEIRGDARHDQVAVLQETDAPRSFGRWVMAKVAEDGGPDIRLLTDRISACSATRARARSRAAPRDPSVPATQESVLSLMRDALAGDTLER